MKKHIIIRDDGRVTYRTKLFTSFGKARAFTRCLTMNGRFEEVMLHRSERSETPKWFVSFLPVNETIQDAMHQAQWDARAARAAEQEFIFWPDPDTKNLYWCYSVGSGETYEVTLMDCTCPDYLYRCQRAGIQCKHMQAWSLQKRDGLIGQTDKKQTPAMAAAHCNINRDF